MIVKLMKELKSRKNVQSENFLNKGLGNIKDNQTEMRGIQ